MVHKLPFLRPLTIPIQELNDEVLYRLLIDNIKKVKENLGHRREFPFPDDDKEVRIFI